MANTAQRSGDVPTAAARLHVQLTEHARVAERVALKTKQLNAALNQAASAGVLKFFNAEYRRRQAAFAAGKKFMPYPKAQKRLRQVVAGIIAKGGLIEASLVSQVFDHPQKSC